LKNYIGIYHIPSLKGSLKNKLPILGIESPAPARSKNAGISGVYRSFTTQQGRMNWLSKCKVIFE
jgi:hypothetical protein